MQDWLTPGTDDFGAAVIIAVSLIVLIVDFWRWK